MFQFFFNSDFFLQKFLKKSLSPKFELYVSLLSNFLLLKILFLKFVLKLFVLPNIFCLEFFGS